MDPLTILNAIAAMLGIIDNVADQIERFSKQEPDPPAEEPHRVLAEKQGDAIHFKEGDVVLETITADDMRQLDAQSRKLIQALEQSMQRQFDLWTQIYPQRNTSPDPLVNAKINNQLKDVAQEMCGDLDKILSFLAQMNKHLYDHYNHVRFVCDEVQSS